VELTDRVVIVTGAAHGIGAGMARRFVAEGAREVVVADLDGDAAEALAEELGAVAVAARVDVTVEADTRGLVEGTLSRHGRVDLFCANAGITSGAGTDATDEQWERTWSVNVLSHVYAARAVLPSMLERGTGYILATCSAAGLLTSVDDAPYAVTKHAAVAHAEWLSIHYGGRGIKVSALCPQGVDTRMLRGGLEIGHRGAKVTAASGAVLPVERVVDAVVAGIAAEEFLILPHPEVAKYERHRATDRERWLAGMRTLAARAEG
jgi:NAD(P)-dependent dehydrogenase (short-subunit alcohol dehydrogenase family)